MENYRDYIDNIYTAEYTMGFIVKDPFANRIGKHIGLEHVTRFWNMYGSQYRLAFDSKENPMSFPFILFSWDKNAVPQQVMFNVGQNIPSVLEKLSFEGHTLFISNSMWRDKNVFWRPYTTLEQVLINLDLESLS